MRTKKIIATMLAFIIAFSIVNSGIIVPSFFTKAYANVLPTNPFDSSMPSVSISHIGDVLIADVIPGVKNPIIEYNWSTGSTGRSYAIKEHDFGTTISVSVKITTTVEGYEFSKTISDSIDIPIPPNPFEGDSTTSVKITGGQNVGETLTATPTTGIEGATVESYSWSTGGTDSTYKLTANDLGKTISVDVVYSVTSQGKKFTKTVKDTIVINAPLENPLKDVSISISGDKTENTALSVLVSNGHKDAVLSYKWKRNEVVVSTNPTYTITKADFGATISVEVDFKLNLEGENFTASANSSVFIPDPTYIKTPSAPQNVTSTPGDKKLTITWTEPKDNGGDEITSYRIKITNQGEVILSKDKRTHTFLGLENDKIYTITLKAVNGAGSGEEVSINATPKELALNKQYIVTFKYEDGKTKYTTQKTNTNGKLTSLPKPTRLGYTFKGWYDKDLGGTQITTSTVFKQNSTIYAQWQACDETLIKDITRVEYDDFGITLRGDDANSQLETMNFNILPAFLRAKFLTVLTLELKFQMAKLLI